MPYLTGSDRQSPCLYQKKNMYAGQCHVIPIQTKRPIDKVTTRSQTQYQHLIKTMGTEALLDNKDRNNNATNYISNHCTKYNYVPTSSKTKPRMLLGNWAPDINANDVKPSQEIRCTLEQHYPPDYSSPESSLAARSKVLASSSSEQTIAATTAAARRLPVAPHKILEHNDYNVHLTSHEKKEIIEWPNVYYIGKTGIKKRTPRTTTIYAGADGQESKLYGFDDNNGSYIPVLHDHIAYRYEVLKIIGKGTFGVVLQACDRKTQQNVALKVIRNQARFHTQAKEEIKILTKLLENDVEDKFNVVHMCDNFMFRNHPCIVFELLSLNLYELSRKNSFTGFTLQLIRRFTFAIIKCLFALSKFDIIHCDLKPENILLKQQNRSGIKVIDFGSSCFSNKRVHSYIQSRYYRSPEVILNGKYGPPIDMWSLGCILSELFIGHPLLDGENEGDQLACMIELLNVPPPAFLARCRTTKVRQFFDSAGNPVYCARYHLGQYRPECGRSPRGKIRGLPGSRRLLSCCKDENFKDFVMRCLEWDPNLRMTPTMALEHPWISK